MIKRTEKNEVHSGHVDSHRPLERIWFLVVTDVSWRSENCKTLPLDYLPLNQHQLSASGSHLFPEPENETTAAFNRGDTQLSCKQVRVVELWSKVHQISPHACIKLNRTEEWDVIRQEHTLIKPSAVSVMHAAWVIMELYFQVTSTYPVVFTNHRLLLWSSLWNKAVDTFDFNTPWGAFHWFWKSFTLYLRTLQ